MNKPLKDWTLGEIHEECAAHGEYCGGCPFLMPNVLLSCRIRIITNQHPIAWDLSEPHHWTDKEIEFVKLFQASCKNDVFFERFKGTQILNWGEVGMDSTADMLLPYKLLPSLKEGERATASEIIGGAE